MDFGEIMSELSRRRVLILGRFSERRLAVLESIKAHLKAHPNKYIPELFTFEKPELSQPDRGDHRFCGIVALHHCRYQRTQERAGRTPGDRAEFPVRSGGAFDQPDRQGVCDLCQPAGLQELRKPTVRYRDLDDLLEKIDQQVVPLAEKRRSRI